MPGLHSYLPAQRARVADLDEAYRRFGDRSEFWSALRSELNTGEPAAVTTVAWMLRRSARDRWPDEVMLRRVLEAASAIDLWTARLLVCQLFAEVNCPPGLADDLAAFLEDAVRDDCPFVRAWALTTAQRLGREHPVFASSAAAWLRAARSDPAASVQARLRRLERAKTTPSVRRRPRKIMPPRRRKPTGRRDRLD